MKGYRLIIKHKPDDLPFESDPMLDLNIKSLDAASALLHMIAQTCADDSKISTINLINLDEDEN